MSPPACHVAILVALTFGCATTKVDAPVTPASVEAVQRENPGATLVVERLAPPAGDSMAGSKGGRLALVRTTPTETIVTERGGGTSSQSSLRNPEVASLTVTNHVRGALYGAAAGALLAAGLIAFAAVKLGPCAGCEQDFTASDAAAVIGFEVGVPVFLLSTGLGALIGTRTTYVFQSP